MDEAYSRGFVPDLFRLDGKVALITGGRGELAELMACTLADLGCAVALASRHPEDCAALAASITERFGRRAIGLRCDISEEADVERAIARLPPGSRSVFVLHDCFGLTHQEIATLLGIHPGTSKSQLFHAHRLLRAMLA